MPPDNNLEYGRTDTPVDEIIQSEVTIWDRGGKSLLLLVATVLLLALYNIIVRLFPGDRYIDVAEHTAIEGNVESFYRDALRTNLSSGTDLEEKIRTHPYSTARLANSASTANNYEFLACTEKFRAGIELQEVIDKKGIVEQARFVDKTPNALTPIYSVSVTKEDGVWKIWSLDCR